MKPKRLIAAMTVAGAALTMPGTAFAEQGHVAAKNILNLDMMLMATSLRCRKGAHDFRAEYQDFSRLNKLHITGANAAVRRNLSATYGKKGSVRELDRMSVRMANRYGSGHPWLGCEELKLAAGELARAHTHASLAETASRLLAPQRIALDRP